MDQPDMQVIRSKLQAKALSLFPEALSLEEKSVIEFLSNLDNQEDHLHYLVKYSVYPDGDCGIHSLLGQLDPVNRLCRCTEQGKVRLNLKKMLSSQMPEREREIKIGYLKTSVYAISQTLKDEDQTRFPLIWEITRQNQIFKEERTSSMSLLKQKIIELTTQNEEILKLVSVVSDEYNTEKLLNNILKECSISSSEFSQLITETLKTLISSYLQVKSSAFNWDPLITPAQIQEYLTFLSDFQSKCEYLFDTDIAALSLATQAPCTVYTCEDISLLLPSGDDDTLTMPTGFIPATKLNQSVSTSEEGQKDVKIVYSMSHYDRLVPLADHIKLLEVAKQDTSADRVCFEAIEIFLSGGQIDKEEFETLMVQKERVAFLERIDLYIKKKQKSVLLCCQ